MLLWTGIRILNKNQPSSVESIEMHVVPLMSKYGSQVLLATYSETTNKLKLKLNYNI